MTDRLVVVGGGAAGMSAASAARRVDRDLDIVVVEATGYAAWGLCGIPYYVGGVVDAAGELVSHPPRYFRDERGIDLRLHTRAVAIDLPRRSISVACEGRQERLGFSGLVVTAGGTPVRPRLPGTDDERVVTVRTMEAARALRARLDAGRIRRALVVGAGYVGLEMAEAFAARGCEVVVVEALEGAVCNLDAEVSAPVEAVVRRHADLRLGTALTALQPGPDRVRAVLGDGTAVDADTVVLAVGVRPSGEIAHAAGAEVTAEGAVVVDDRMRTSLDHVYAAGDCIAPYHRILERPAYVPLGPTANKTGRVAGTVAAGGDARFAGVVGTAVMKVFDLTVARTGLTLAEARSAGIPARASDTVVGSRAKYYPGGAPTRIRLVHAPDGRLLGAQLVSTDPTTAKRVDVLAAALHTGMDVATIADLDLSYAPPYAPVYDPVTRAAQQAQWQIASDAAAVA